MKKVIIFLVIFFEFSSNGHSYPQPFEGYFSQKGQDKFLNEQIFNNKKNGFFIEIGAHDGISFSNTYYFEKNLNWRGICVEPNPTIFEKLTQNRKCYCEQVCIADNIGQKPFLRCTGYMIEMYSGLIDNYDPRHLERIDKEIAFYGGSKEIIFVQCVTFNNLLKKYNVSHVDLLSIDIEGGEEALIKTIDFDAVTIDIIVVENNFNEDRVKKILLSKNYKHIARLGKDDIYQYSIVL